jgi:hypothetical protein
MNIEDQLELFFEVYGEPADNSKITPQQALGRINRSRRNLATKLKFYDVKDSITAAGGEGYWTMREDFLGIYEKARDCVFYDGKPVIMKTLADWGEITNDLSISVYGPRYGMLHGRTFYIYPPAQAGKITTWWAYGVPPSLGALTGGDAYLTDIQAELTVRDAALEARAENGEIIPERMERVYKELYNEVKKKATSQGPRLEPAPEYY